MPRGHKGDKTTECIGRSKGGLPPKIHAPCDALGTPTGVHLPPGQAHDLAGVDAPRPAIVADIQSLLADKAYDAPDRGLAFLENAGVTAVRPPKANRKAQREYDKDMSKSRHWIENFFANLKQFRGIATRDDTRASTFLGAMHLAAALIWLN
jgi:transposase